MNQSGTPHTCELASVGYSSSLSLAGRSYERTGSALGYGTDRSDEVGTMTDDEGQRRARLFLKQLLGDAPKDLCWDDTHHLQGHVHIGDSELVVIAPRDERHQPIVLTAEDWDAIRHAPGEQAGDLVRQRAIHDHDELTAAVSRSRSAGARRTHTD